MKDKLTIIIPSKNEGDTLYQCINYLSTQTNISGTQIIIADISDDPYSSEIIGRIKVHFREKLNIKIIKGGYPAEGRLAGSKLATTPYILFLDADVMLINDTLKFILRYIQKYKLSLVTIPFSTTTKWNWVYRLFDVSQWLSIKLKTPFAVGGFQLWNRQVYWKLGGYNPKELFAEDYSLSSKVNVDEFGVYDLNKVYTSPRRFENKGFLFMFWIMIKSYLNRNNPKFFKHHHNYWN